MNGKLKILALLLILPLLTVVLTIPQADAEKGDGKSCPNKSMKGTSYTKNYSKLAIKTIQKQQI